MSPINSLFTAFGCRTQPGSKNGIPRRGSRHRRGHGAAGTRLVGCEQLERKQVMAASLIAAIADQTLASTTPVTINLASHFGESAVTGTVVKFETNAPLGSRDFFVELFDQPGAGRVRTTPNTVANFLSYVNDPDALDNYDETIVHRAVPGFVVQGGGYTAPDRAANLVGSDPVAVPQKPAVDNEPGNLNVRGTIAMAKLGNQPNSATNQFFFNLGNNTNLNTDNGGYTVFGRVLGSGMTVIDTMAASPSYDATTYYGNQAFDDFPLWNVNADNIVQPNDFVKLTNVSVAPELSYTVTVTENGQASTKVVADQALLANGQLKLTPAANATGTLSVTVTGRSVVDGTTASGTFEVNLGPDPLTAIESTGTVLNRSGVGLLYAGSTQIVSGASPVNFSTYVGWGMTALGVENSYFSDGSAGLLWKLTDGTAFIWKLNGTTYARSTGTETHSPGTTSFYGVETAFNVDVNGDGVVGSP